MEGVFLYKESSMFLYLYSLVIQEAKRERGKENGGSNNYLDFVPGRRSTYLEF